MLREGALLRQLRGRHEYKRDETMMRAHEQARFGYGTSNGSHDSRRKILAAQGLKVRLR
jgi:hypothetical protein